MLFSRLQIFSSSQNFSVCISLFGFSLYRSETQGASWHAITRPIITDHSGSHDFTQYRIEVCNLAGESKIIVGGFLCWIYGIDCL